MIKGLDQKGRPMKMSPRLKIENRRKLSLRLVKRFRTLLPSFSSLIRSTYFHSASRILISTLSVSSLRKLKNVRKFFTINDHRSYLYRISSNLLRPRWRTFRINQITLDTLTSLVDIPIFS